VDWARQEVGFFEGPLPLGLWPNMGARAAARKIEKGIYTLDLSGRKADGRSATTAVRVAIRR
jgi:hypothetical protein